mmetsp:Transcript_21968/g.56078  ORF Transcript_21968/g.56078 Transcript_21968/m.56078 type:complete len:113 (+) Transcript_21968:146-484(+)
MCIRLTRRGPEDGPTPPPLGLPSAVTALRFPLRSHSNDRDVIDYSVRGSRKTLEYRMVRHSHAQQSSPAACLARERGRRPSEIRETIRRLFPASSCTHKAVHRCVMPPSRRR